MIALDVFSNSKFHFLLKNRAFCYSSRGSLARFRGSQFIEFFSGSGGGRRPFQKKIGVPENSIISRNMTQLDSNKSTFRHYAVFEEIPKIYLNYRFFDKGFELFSSFPACRTHISIAPNY